SGMFVWRASTILEKFRTYLPEVYACLEQIAAAFGTKKEAETVNAVYPTIPSVSVDYGIMEKCNDILVVPAEFGWNDVGSLDMFNVLHDADESGNIRIGETIAFDTKNTTVYSSGKLVATIGVDNLIVVETPDAVLVCTKEKAQDVKKIVDELKSKGKEELL
ncbi:MAG: mannose-1-phosphate guanylyltransferase, partial [Clostridia bacterium]|nr:mannose-1-phosphate guanylyltransferase [Clostridia bacterium]